MGETETQFSYRKIYVYYIRLYICFSGQAYEQDKNTVATGLVIGFILITKPNGIINSD